MKYCEACNKKLTPKQKRCCSRKCSRKFSKGFIGKKHSPQDLKKMSDARFKNPNRYWLGKKFSEDHIRKVVASHVYKVGEDHWEWKGEGAGYITKHNWMKRHFGNPEFCEGCGTEESLCYEWANISAKYLRVRDDWLRLCGSCHRKFDRVGYKSWETRRQRYGKSGEAVLSLY